MKRKGFTLTELLAVIAILGVIALIAFPAMTKTVNTSKEKLYESQKDIILSSAKNWALDNNSLKETEITYLTIDQLQKSGYLEAKDAVNPINDQKMTGCIVIEYNESYNQYEYSYHETSCAELQAP